MLSAGGHRQLCEKQRVGDHRTSGDKAHRLQDTRPGATSTSDVLPQDQASRRVLHVHSRRPVPSALIPHARHILAAARISRQNDPR